MFQDTKQLCEESQKILEELGSKITKYLRSIANEGKLEKENIVFTIDLIDAFQLLIEYYDLLNESQKLEKHFDEPLFFQVLSELLKRLEKKVDEDKPTGLGIPYFFPKGTPFYQDEGLPATWAYADALMTLVSLIFCSQGKESGGSNWPELIVQKLQNYKDQIDDVIERILRWLTSKQESGGWELLYYKAYFEGILPDKTYKRFHICRDLWSSAGAFVALAFWWFNKEKFKKGAGTETRVKSALCESIHELLSNTRSFCMRYGKGELKDLLSLFEIATRENLMIDEEEETISCLLKRGRLLVRRDKKYALRIPTYLLMMLNWLLRLLEDDRFSSELYDTAEILKKTLLLREKVVGFLCDYYVTKGPWPDETVPIAIPSDTPPYLTAIISSLNTPNLPVISLYLLEYLCIRGKYDGNEGIPSPIIFGILNNSVEFILYSYRIRRMAHPIGIFTYRFVFQRPSSRLGRDNIYDPEKASEDEKKELLSKPEAFDITFLVFYFLRHYITFCRKSIGLMPDQHVILPFQEEPDKKMSEELASLRGFVDDGKRLLLSENFLREYLKPHSENVKKQLAKQILIFVDSFLGEKGKQFREKTLMELSKEKTSIPLKVFSQSDIKSALKYVADNKSMLSSEPRDTEVGVEPIAQLSREIHIDYIYKDELGEDSQSINNWIKKKIPNILERLKTKAI